MRPLKIVGIFAAAVIAFVFGIFVFAPWWKIGVYAFDTARLRAAESGVYISADGFEEVGSFSPRYTIRTLDIETPVAKVTLHNVDIRIFPLSSILARGASVTVSYSRGLINAIPNVELSQSAGRIDLTLNREKINVVEVVIAGDMSMKGGCTFDLNTRKMIDSTISFTVPEKLIALLKNPMLGRFIEQDENGGWRIKYEAKDRR